MEEAKRELPYTFAVPEDYDQLIKLFSDRTPAEQVKGQGWDQISISYDDWWIMANLDQALNLKFFGWRALPVRVQLREQTAKAAVEH